MKGPLAMFMCMQRQCGGHRHPTPTLLHGHVPTSVGHNLNREILRQRPDIGAVIYVHHDEMIAFFAAGATSSAERRQRAAAAARRSSG
jgi:ribulose-5-phosphate 4-epimerase/fuculose-1-phosphate aldolase